MVKGETHYHIPVRNLFLPEDYTHAYKKPIIVEIKLHI